jgi:hypothetical protein
VLRLRFYDGAARATVTVKGKQVLREGVGTASEVEEEVPRAALEGGWVGECQPPCARVSCGGVECGVGWGLRCLPAGRPARRC